MERFPPEVITKDTTITIVRDSIIHDTVIIPGELIFWRDTIPCPQLEYHKSVTKNHLTSSVDISKGKIDVECKADSLQKVIDIKQKIINTYREKANTQIKERVEYKEHWYGPFAGWYTLITLVILIIYAAVRLIMKFYTGK